MFNVSVITWCCFASVVLSLAGFLVSRRFVNQTGMEEHQPFLNATLTIVGTLVSILLGLLVANSIDFYEGVQANANNEATAVADLVRLSRGLPSQSRLPICKLCLEYNHEVENVEWLLMESGATSRNADLLYLKLNDTVLDFEPKSNRDNNIHTALVSTMQQLGDCRRTRLMTMRSSWCHRILPVVGLCAIIVLVYTYLYTRREKRSLHAILISFVAICLGANVAMIFLLRSPFATDWKIEPFGFRLNDELIKHYQKEGASF